MANPLANDLDHILVHTEHLWEELRGERLFITGGTGFFGCWLLESFAWANDKLGLKTRAVVLTRDPEAFRRKAIHLVAHPSIELYQGDIRSFNFPNGSFSHLIHGATEASAKLNEQDPLLMFDTIVEGTRRTLEFAHYCGATKLLFVSSGAVYGKQPPNISHISEGYSGAPDTTDPRSAYGQGKRAAETLCMLHAKQYGLEIKIPRCFAFVGPYFPLDIHFAIGNFIRDGLRGGPIQVKGDGTPYRSYLYAADLAIWLWTILFGGESCRPYNVGSSEAVTVANLANLVSGSFSPPSNVCIAEQPAFGKAAERYVPSVERALLELGLRQTIDLRESIERTISWARQ